MPALIHNSPKFTNNLGIALISQAAQEQPTGLVRIEAVYALTQERATNIIQGLDDIFVHDAAPPIYPSVYRRSSLHQGRLFLETYRVEKAFGQWRVAASYVGARLARSSFGGFITRDSEARITPPYRTPDYTISVRFVAQVVKTSIAAAGGGFFDLEGITEGIGDIDSRVSRLQYGVISLPGTDLSVPREQRQTLINFNLLPPTRSIFYSFNPAVRTSTSVNNVTNSVIIATTTRDIVFLQGGGN
jgi:hypothetical protein